MDVDGEECFCVGYRNDEFYVFVLIVVVDEFDILFYDVVARVELEFVVV